jgi:predicted RNase H-like HicB family nuclease
MAKAAAERGVKKIRRTSGARKPLPLIVERGQDGYYVVECPLLPGCYTQGKTLDEALRNIREAIELVLEERDARKVFEDYQPTEISFHTITL